jgi:hypothetical protein
LLSKTLWLVCGWSPVNPNVKHILSVNLATGWWPHRICVNIHIYSNIYIYWYIHILWYYIHNNNYFFVYYIHFIFIILFIYRWIYIYVYLPHSSFRETSFHLRSTTFHRQLLRHIAMFSSLQPREASGTAKHGGVVGSLKDVVRKPSIWWIGYNCLVDMGRIIYCNIGSWRCISSELSG